jgi:hypothetical protein
MYSEERQERIEETVFDSIEEIAEEFALEIPFYPQVHCLSKSTRFEDLCLPLYFQKDFDEIGKIFSACFIQKSFSILLGLKPLSNYCGEEATHFVHYVNSNIKRKNRDPDDLGFIECLSEMLGFFGSLVLGEERQNQYSGWPDPYSQPKEFKELLPQLKLRYTQPAFLLDQVIHQQGYGLGERLFYFYQDSFITKKEITQLFKNDFREKNSPRKVFIELRKRLDWPIKISGP